MTAQAAHHWASAGDQPQALAAAVRAALAAEKVNAFGEAQALFERALALWERVPEPELTAGIDHVDLLKRAALACDQAGDPARQEALLRRALELVGEDTDPRTYALLLERVSQSLWSQHRQDEAIEELKRGLALLPPGEQSSERATLLSQLAKKRMLQSRVTESKEGAEEALAVARASGNREAEGRALNALGTVIGVGGDPDAGVKMLRESLAIARELGLPWDEGGAWVNIADVLHLAGRTKEAIEVAREGLEAESDSPWRTVDWFRLTIADCSFHLGEWDEAEAAMPAPSRRHTGGTFLFWQLTRAMLALGRGDLEVADEALHSLDHALEGMTEPQFVGPHGMLSSELARRRGNITAARAAIDDAIDRIEYCSDDMPRVTSVSGAGLRVEGDAAQLAHDRRDGEAESHARKRAESLIERVRLASASGGPVERGAGGLGRGGVRPRRRGGRHRIRGRLDRGPLGERRVGLGGARAALPGRIRALARGRGAAGGARPRGRGTRGLRRARHRTPARKRLAGGGGRVARRAGTLQLGADGAAARPSPSDEADEDPFGLTPRERDVLALVAAGATNREIGEQLHMAEKTASVHVSRILAKLNVRSRTEAAAVAHRQGLVPTA